MKTGALAYDTAAATANQCPGDLETTPSPVKNRKRDTVPLKIAHSYKLVTEVATETEGRRQEGIWRLDI